MSQNVRSEAMTNAGKLDVGSITIEHVLASLAAMEARLEKRLQARLEAHARGAAETRPPPRPDPDPPYSSRDDTTRDRAVLTTATGVSSLPYQFYAAQQPPTHNQYVAARSWQQDRASFDQLDRYPPQLDPDPPDSVDWWQPYHPYNQSTPAARQPHAYQPQTQTFITPFGQQLSIDMDPIVHQRNPDAGYHQGQPEYQPPRTPSHCSDFYGQRQTHHEGYHPWQPSYHLAGQPLQFDQSLSHRTAPLPAAVPPQSGSTQLPLQARKFTDSEQQRDLHNIPSLKVRSLSPAQLAAINDYNEKLRVYRLDQAALLARVTARFEENTDDENIIEENIDNTFTMVFSADVPKDIQDVPNSITDVAINTAVGVDVSDEIEQSEGSQDEAREMLRDNKVLSSSALQVLPQTRKNGGQRLLDKDGVGQVSLKVLNIAMAHRNLIRRYAQEFFKFTRSCMFSKSVIAFDPGGETSTLLFSPTLFAVVVSWFPP